MSNINLANKSELNLFLINTSQFLSDILKISTFLLKESLKIEYKLPFTQKIFGDRTCHCLRYFSNQKQ